MPCIVSLPQHSSYHPYTCPSLSTFRTTSLRPLRGGFRREFHTSRNDMDFSASSATSSVGVDAHDSSSRAASLAPSASSNPSTASPLIGHQPIEVDLQHSISSAAILSESVSQCPSSSIATSTPSLLALTKPTCVLPLKSTDRTIGPIQRKSQDLSSTVGPSLTTRSVISYLKAWQPPVEYYARRRHHPSLTPPSRRPMLPALLEEQVMPEGHLGLVRPELVIGTTSFRRIARRSSCGCYSCPKNTLGGSGFSPCARVGASGMRVPEIGGWDDESDEDDVHEDDSDDQLSDDDSDDDWSESEVAEAVTPVSSPGSPSGFILQPLFLTKPPGC